MSLCGIPIEIIGAGLALKQNGMNEVTRTQHFTNILKQIENFDLMVAKHLQYCMSMLDHSRFNIIITHQIFNEILVYYVTGNVYQPFRKR